MQRKAKSYMFCCTPSWKHCSSRTHRVDRSAEVSDAQFSPSSEGRALGGRGRLKGGEVEEGRRGQVWYSLQVCIFRTGCHLQYTYIESSSEPDSPPIHTTHPSLHLHIPVETQPLTSPSGHLSLCLSTISVQKSATTEEEDKEKRKEHISADHGSS